MGLDAMILVFWMLRVFTLLFHFQEALQFLFAFRHKGGVICISEAIDISWAVLIPACASSSPTFHMMYSAYKLNKQGDNIRPSRTPFPIWNQSVVPCLILTVASWPAYRFLSRQVRWSGILISVRIFQFAMMENTKATFSTFFWCFCEDNFLQCHIETHLNFREDWP